VRSEAGAAYSEAGAAYSEAGAAYSEAGAAYSEAGAGISHTLNHTLHQRTFVLAFGIQYIPSVPTRQGSMKCSTSSNHNAYKLGFIDCLGVRGAGRFDIGRATTFLRISNSPDPDSPGIAPRKKVRYSIAPRWAEWPRDCVGNALTPTYESPAFTDAEWNEYESGYRAGLEKGLSVALEDLMARQSARRARVRRRWAIVKAAVKLLASHARAVVSANHPSRLRDRGVFDDLATEP